MAGKLMIRRSMVGPERNVDARAEPIDIRQSGQAGRISSRLLALALELQAVIEHHRSTIPKKP
jgi:hypothetical protein